MTRGINLSTSSTSRTSRTSRTTGKQGEKSTKSNNNGTSVNNAILHYHHEEELEGEEGRLDEDERRMRRKKKGGVSLAGGSSKINPLRRRGGRRSSTAHSDEGSEEEEDARMSISSPRAVRYSARTSRKSSMHQMPQASFEIRASTDSLASNSEIVPVVAAPTRQRRNILFSSTSYSTLVTMTIVLLAWSLVMPAQAALSCTTDADCSAKGIAKCKQDKITGASTCVFKSCSAGYWGAGNTYDDCFECPKGMTSLEGKAFYETDCFLPCGDNRCYVPEDGRTECTIEPATATHMCFSTCNDASYNVINANKPYATCVRKSQVQKTGSKNSTGIALTNQASNNNNAASKRKVVKLFNKRGEGEGRRLKLKKDVDLRHQGPAVALLRDAGRDPLALVSK